MATQAKAASSGACSTTSAHARFAGSRVSSMSIDRSHEGAETGGLVKLFCLLFLAGVAMRMTLLAVPPVIPLVHTDLHMSETQIGLLIGLPLAVFAIAAVPGSLLIARVGSRLAVTLGVAFAALASGARGAAVDVWTLYAAATATGFGIAIMQPAMPLLVREWLPARMALGTIAYSSGMIIGATLPPTLTLGVVLPLLGGSWRLNFVLWALPPALIAPVFFLLSPRETAADRAIDRTLGGSGALWWPDWKSPLVWLLGLTFGANSAPFFVSNAFLGDYLAARGQAQLLGATLSALNGAQIIGLVVLIATSGRLQGRAWPFAVFGPAMVAAFIALIVVHEPLAIVICAGVIGLGTSITMTAVLALPPLLAAPADVSRTAAGMLTISYTCAIVIPTICGALWDLTGLAWTAFILPTVCCVGLATLGSITARRPPAAGKIPGR
jgi:MFS transporter, CP family, cyanate transporter